MAPGLFNPLLQVVRHGSSTLLVLSWVSTAPGTAGPGQFFLGGGWHMVVAGRKGLTHLYPVPTA